MLQEGVKRLKKELIQNRIKRVVPSVKPHPVNPATPRKESVCSKGNQQAKAYANFHLGGDQFPASADSSETPDNENRTSFSIDGC